VALAVAAGRVEPSPSCPSRFGSTVSPSSSSMSRS